MEATFELGDRIELMKRMGETVDGDIFEALSEGQMSGWELFEAVQRCAGCRDAGPCAVWLAQAQPTASAPPAFCRNRALLRRLSTEHAPRAEVA
ncbi:DUF6455 family protein [Alkalilacustris brevis]|uniref:DUF6455 family protein n=1 Tax=Alkalilacustris brevis TaxID=2026338 RepID=UPI000E0DA4F4|nr:DUF6455 family protein [Alkalilacustris brevis]